MGRGTAYVGAAIVVLGLAGTRVAVARDDTPAVERLSLEELMGVRVRTPAMSSQPMETAPSMISVITAEQIHALGLRTLPDALQLMPGVTVLPTSSAAQRVVDARARQPERHPRHARRRAAQRLLRRQLLHRAAAGERRAHRAHPRSRLGALRHQRLRRRHLDLLARPARRALRRRRRRGSTSTTRPAGACARYAEGGAHVRPLDACELFGSLLGDLGAQGAASTPTTPTRATARAGGDTNGHLRLGVAQLVGQARGPARARRRARAVGATISIGSAAPYFGPNNVFAPDSTLERQSAAHLPRLLGAAAGAACASSTASPSTGATPTTSSRISRPATSTRSTATSCASRARSSPTACCRAFSFVTYRLVRDAAARLGAAAVDAASSPTSLIVGAALDYQWLPDVQLRSELLLRGGLHLRRARRCATTTTCRSRRWARIASLAVASSCRTSCR